MKEGFAGRHLILDAVTVSDNRYLLGDIKVVYDFLMGVTRDLDMTMTGPPIVYNFPYSQGMVERIQKELKKAGINPAVLDMFKDYENKNGGVSGTVIWTDSHLCIHTFPFLNFFSMDAYSCKDFIPGNVIDLARLSFGRFVWAHATNLKRFIQNNPEIESYVVT